MLNINAQNKIREALQSLRTTATIGFEIETQCKEEPVFDRDAAYDYARDTLDEETIVNYAGLSWNSTSKAWCDKIGGLDAIASALGVDTDDIIDSVVSDLEENRDSAFWSNTDCTYWRLVGEVVCPAGFDFCDDGSVSGPEFQSEVCIGRDDAIAHAKRLFEAIYKDARLTIDSDCSCHIHIRLDKVFHTGSNLLQQMLFQEVSKRFDRLPPRVRYRISSVPKWIAPHTESENTCKYKYNPIQCHDQGTWEFRLFGNVDNTSDFEECLDIAYEAMEEAYTTLLNSPTPIQPMAPELWVEEAKEAMRTLSPCLVEKTSQEPATV